MDNAANHAPAAAPTVSQLLGEITWLLTQSPLHRALAIGDIEWLVMPALLNRQFYLFRDGEQPAGLALWALCDAEAASKLQRGMIAPENRLTLAEWSSGDQVWLVDLIAPFAAEDNHQRELMIADLISGPLAGRAIHMQITDPASGAQTVRTIPADAGAALQAVIGAAEG